MDISAFDAIAIVAVVAGALVVLSTLSATALFCLAIAAEMFSGSNGLIGLPIGPDRVLMALAFVKLLTEQPRAIAQFGRHRVHYIMAALVVLLVISGIAVGSFLTSNGFFIVLDRVGVFPFLGFIFAPIFFATGQQRRLLAFTLMGCGAYLGVIAILEMTGLYQFVVPRYIANPYVGIHFGRARGPFLESTTDGLGLLAGAVGAGAVAFMPNRKVVRGLAVVIVALCLAGMFLTLTRSIWIGIIVGPLVFLGIRPNARKALVPLFAVAAVGVLVTLATVPSISERATERSSSQEPLWDRYNTNRAAVDAFADHPLFGIGLGQFASETENYLRQTDAYPLTGSGLEVHNVFLARYAELGLIGGTLWLAALLLVAARCVFARMRPNDLVWKQVALAFGAGFMVVSMFAPNSAPMPNLLFWTFAGIVYSAALPRRGEQPIDDDALVPVSDYPKAAVDA